jgi:hypothetical protein
MSEPGRTRPTAIGAWRLLEIVTAALPWRGTMLGGGELMPRLGLPDPPSNASDPDQELPDSYLSEHEQRQAVQKERVRRFVRARRVTGGR